MANLDGTWLERPKRQERIDLLTERLRKLLTLYKSGKASDYHVDMLRKDKAELMKLKRVHRAEYDVAYFVYEYLSDGSNPENEDNIVMNADDGSPHDSIEDMAPIHREFFDLCDYVDHEDRSANLAIAAARGHSKSGKFSNGLPLHQVVFRKRRYILTISETDSLSKKLIGWVNKQLKFNAKLREDFGELMHESSSRNEKDNEEAFITNTNALVEASSSGKQLRGKRHGSIRPDLVIVDDPSSMNNEGTKEAREKLISWFNSVVIPIGSKSTAIILVGTMVSATGLLNHVLKRKDFKPSFHGAIVSDPTEPELWEEYCEVYARADELAEADEFYETHRERLEAGVETAWPWRWTYRDLMHAKVNMGTRSFNSEFRNLAFSEDEQFFFPEKFAYYAYKTTLEMRSIYYEGEEIPLSDLTISGAWDLAMGRNARSCFNSVITVGKHAKSGRVFVLDEYSSKEQPHKFLDIVVDKIMTIGHNVFSVETINAYHEFYRQLEEALRKKSHYRTRLNPIKSHKASKEQRMESLEPMCHNKSLIFNENHKTLLDQMAQYPHGDYVDSIDALELAVENVAKPKARIIDRPAWL
jgi:predicted phage terminase large subunit-like protein